MKYEPTFPSSELTNQYIYEELTRIGNVMNAPTFLLLDVNHVPPDKPQDGMVICADGTDWNPGAGAGLYLRISGAWTKL